MIMQTSLRTEFRLAKQLDSLDGTTIHIDVGLSKVIFIFDVISPLTTMILK